MRICHFYPKADVAYYRQDTMMRCLHRLPPLEGGVKPHHPKPPLPVKSHLAELPNDKFERLASIPILLLSVLPVEVPVQERRRLPLNAKARLNQ